ncbi:DNA-binding LacI/PurR family transcriptional regulator [Microlunatus panaciterrae]|uniref:DNA-binding LacI/PurR family transcriptional regulator n=1 Tax=Microlunatus panaciterrae TaxID=400768 RepID=A0ABS2RJ16_9ACTN|nr:LacI family DNA-binding transcriptional regulator [Microlunatus panaciterrae]MBM7798984.1 DNA-binding LacI/PurR family transcriptional regulator [Microlunatus panaciterrae]
MAARLRDVAALAGVSVKTASNVLNNHPHIKASTRAKVEAAIAELHYRPNISARKLKYGRAGFLALAVPRMQSPYFAELAAEISAEASELGYIVLLDVTGATAEAERIVLDGMRSHVIDGVIFSPLALSADEIARRADPLPMVLLGERAIPPGFDHVSVDSVTAAAAMTEHLLSLGRRRVAAIGRESVQGTASVRLQGYRQALTKAGVAFDAEIVVGVAHYERQDGYQAMQQLLALPERPDAVFCFNDLMAIGALRACAEAGVRVPQDVAVAGFDDIAEGRFSNPTLTTVSVDLQELSRQALRLLISRIDGSTTPAESIIIPYRLELRESTVGAASTRVTPSQPTCPEPAHVP